MPRAYLTFLALTIVLPACEKGPPGGAPGSGPASPPGSAVAPGAAATPVAAGGTAAPAAAPEGTPVRLPSGIEYTVLKAGEGPTPRLGSRVRIHLTGRLLDGQVFMDTRAHGVPREYRLDKLELINGLVDQLLEMKKGERRRIRIPSALAYGAAGYRGQVPGNADLDVDVELVGFGP